MRKMLGLFILATSASLLHADYNANSNNVYNANQYNQAPQGQYTQGPNSSRMNQVYDQDSNSQNQNQQGYGYYGQGNGSQNDQQLTTSIQTFLKTIFSNKYSNVSVSVNNGTVTLSGTVASQDDKNYLEQKIRSIPGVQNVNNQIRVQNQGQGNY